MKKAVIICCSDTFEYRVDMVYKSLKNAGWQVEVITSDYMHIEKRKRKVSAQDYTSVNTIPYKKNISIRRLYSHYDFAKKSYDILKKKDVDLLYLVIPANSIATIAKKIKKKSNVKVILDIIDLWPESLPIGKTNEFPFNLWGNIRNRGVKYADYIITECDLYRSKLDSVLKDKKVKTIYWCHKKNKDFYKRTTTLPNELTLCYLGSVNNIIDIPKITEVVASLLQKESVVVKLIAAGEKKQELKDSLMNIGARVIDYGKVYDYVKKKEIIDTCHYGINIMKETVSVGISMKSIDYLEMGLPIINNLDGDLANLIEKYECGINIRNKSTYDLGVYNIMMRNNCRKLYENFFSEEEFNKRLSNVLYEIYK